MLKFVFILTIWNAEGEPHAYVTDHNLSGDDCIALLEDFTINPEPNATPSCEVDHGSLSAIFMHEGDKLILPPCEYEDSANCYWDAGASGNGRGQSFYDVEGQRFPFTP